VNNFQKRMYALDAYLSGIKIKAYTTNGLNPRTPEEWLSEAGIWRLADSRSCLSWSWTHDPDDERKPRVKIYLSVASPDAQKRWGKVAEAVRTLEQLLTETIPEI